MAGHRSLLGLSAESSQRARVLAGRNVVMAAMRHRAPRGPGAPEEFLVAMFGAARRMTTEDITSRRQRATIPDYS